VLRQLDVWATHGVTGHFTAIPASAAAPAAPPWVDVDAHAARMVAPIVGAADAAEVAVMQTLSANLHLLLCAFYRPDAQGRHEILLEDKAFPSDHVRCRQPSRFPPFL
jgi:kynureninase